MNLNPSIKLTSFFKRLMVVYIQIILIMLIMLIIEALIQHNYFIVWIELYRTHVEYN